MCESLDSSASAPRCERCHGPLERGLCPRCLLQEGLEDGLPVLEEPDPPPSASQQPPLDKPPEGMPTVDGFEFLAEIGRGGMGVVYLAEQTGSMRRRVALKLIKLGMDTKQVIGRFEAERQALALMEHPNVAKVFAAGASATGRPYFVMELVSGPRITDYCDQYHLSTRERLEVFLQVCRAIQHAHQKGIIHRDIKPSNILVTQQDGAAVPKVIDFGIAKATGGQPLTDKTVFSSLDQFLGTPAYSSPEQAAGGGDVDTRTDVYSLGVLLYELLTGKTPFDSKQLLRGGWEAMRRTIRETEPQRPSTRLTTLASGELHRIAKCRRIEPPRLIDAVRGDLDWIVMKCLEKERARRYGTCSGLAHDVERHLLNEPVAARPPGNLYRLQKFVRRNRLWFVAGSAVAAALVIGLGASSWSLHREEQAAQAARASEAKARAALSFFAEIVKRFPTNDARSTKSSAGSLHSPGRGPMPENSPSATNTAHSSPVVSPLPPYPPLVGLWSQWMMQLPLTNSAGVPHPNIDTPVFDVTEGQAGEVWFLTAPFGAVTRSCIVPSDKWLFFAVLDAESSSLEDPPFFAQSTQDQAKIARYFSDHAVSLFCEIDGTPVPDLRSYRFTSPQITFTVPSPWVYGQIGGTGTSTGDGYFIMLKPLGSGQHTLHYGGAFQFRTPADPFDLDAQKDMTYHLLVP